MSDKIPEHALMHTLASDLQEAKRNLAQEGATQKHDAPVSATPLAPVAAGGSFDSVACFKDIEKTYLNLEDSLREKGIDFDKMPQDVWNAANEALQEAKRLDEAYRKEHDTEKTGAIADQMQETSAKLSGSITKMFKDAMRELEKGEAHPAAPVPHPEN